MLTGTTIPKLFQYVVEFYKQRRQRRFRIDRLCEPITLNPENPENPGQTNSSDDDADYFSTQTLDLGLRKKIWGGLLNEPDFMVGRNNEGKDVDLEEIEAAYASNSENPAAKEVEKQPQDEEVDEEMVDEEMGDKDADTQNDASTSDAVQSKPQKATKWKVYASIERRWRALAGHGIDHKKVL